jgi:DNA-binding transcriptional ArsR family regulator
VNNYRRRPIGRNSDGPETEVLLLKGRPPGESSETGPCLAFSRSYRSAARNDRVERLDLHGFTPFHCWGAPVTMTTGTKRALQTAGAPLCREGADPSAEWKGRPRHLSRTSSPPLVLAAWNLFHAGQDEDEAQIGTHRYAPLPQVGLIAYELSMTAASDIRKQKYAEEINVALNQALSHPLRHRILAIMDERPASPTEIAKELGETREKIAYHVRVLAGQESDDAIPLIELVRINTARGGREHFYRSIVRPIIDTAASSKLSRLTREITSATTIDLIVGDLNNAFEAGAFDSHPARSLLRDEILVDDQGMHETGEIMMRCLAELNEVQAESINRMAKTAETGISVATALLAYPKG